MYHTSDFQRPKPESAWPAVLSLVPAILVTVLWILFVQHLVSTATVSQDEHHWIQKAHQDYRLCYKGCTDCLYVDVIADACRKTRIIVPGSICAASKIWFWEDRYPELCLSALGNIYRAEALASKQFWLEFWHILTPVFFFLTYMLSYATFSTCSFDCTRPRALNSRSRRNSLSRQPLLTIAAVTILALCGPVAAFPCINHYPAYDRPFSNIDGTLYGTIHGWLSSCHWEEYECGETCTTSSSDGQRSCTTKWCVEEKAHAGPIDFVNDASKYVERCGFRMVDWVPGVVAMRVPNPEIEGKLWVKMSVNRFNGSEGLEPMAGCLYDII
ncbi:uncharacterized protein PAC_05037 [Phialocephala subalpina]|uniref:Uncharacterized protein n=1 Tax=Phialocephala subalpina TaxID=576137 RepID=A0A1L7WQW3_9HELO|nr:uncharacterized protein PAC_05037 [Phialocephala subalpina]